MCESYLQSHTHTHTDLQTCRERQKWGAGLLFHCPKFTIAISRRLSRIFGVSLPIAARSRPVPSRSVPVPLSSLLLLLGSSSFSSHNRSCNEKRMRESEKTPQWILHLFSFRFACILPFSHSHLHSLSHFFSFSLSLRFSI